MSKHIIVNRMLVHKSEGFRLRKNFDTAQRKREQKIPNLSIFEKKVFFKFAKADKAQQIVGGIVYEPDATDTHGDYTTAEEIQKAMYRFMEKYSDGGGQLKVQHKGKDYGFPILEVFQPESDIKKGGQTVKKGAWWMMLKVPDPVIWKAIESGKLTGFSMGGTARV